MAELQVDVSQVLAALDKIDARISSLEKGYGSLDAAGKKLAQSSGKDVAKSLTDQAAAAQDVTKALKDLETQSAAAGKKSPINAEAVKNAGSLKQQAAGVAGAIGDVAGATDKLTVAQRLFNAVAKANPLGLILTAIAAIIGTVIAYFSRFQGAMDTISQITAGLSAAFNVLIDRIAAFGKGIVSIFQGNFSEGFNEIGNAVSGLGTAMAAAGAAAAALEKQLQQLQDAEIANITAFAKRQQQIEKLKAISDDETKSIGARTRALKEASAEESALFKDRIAQAEAFLQNQKATLAQSGLQRDEQRQIAEAEKALIELKGEADKSAIDNQSKINALQKQGAEAAKRANDQLQKDLDKITETIERLRVATQDDGLDRELAAINKKYDDLGQAAAAGIAKLNEIEGKRGLTDAQKAQREELQQLEVKLEEQRLSALVSALADFNEKERQLDEEQIRAREALAKKDLDAARKALTNVRDLQLQQADFFEAQGEAYAKVLRDRGVKESEIQEVLARFQFGANKKRLEAQIQFEQAFLATIDQSDTDQIALVKAKIATLQQQLAGLDVKAPAGKKKSLFELLGLSGGPEDDKKLEEATGKIVGALQQITAARVAEAEAALQAADNKVQAAQQALDTELALAEQGFASNVALRQRELDDAKKARETALKEQQKAQRAQLALDTALQISNIATAATSIFKEGAKFWPVGFVLAIASVASLFALMAGVRAKARAISAPQFKQGGEARVDGNSILVGASHDQGGIGIEAEHGEFITTDGKRLSIVNKGMTAKHFDLLSAINRDDRKKIAWHAMQLADAPELDRIGIGKSLSPVNAPIGLTGRGDSRQLAVLIDIQQRQLALMIRGEGKPVISPDGRTVTRGNRKTTYLG